MRVELVFLPLKFVYTKKADTTNIRRSFELFIGNWLATKSLSYSMEENVKDFYCHLQELIFLIIHMQKILCKVVHFRIAKSSDTKLRFRILSKQISLRSSTAKIHLDIQFALTNHLI